jgi:Tfp pilus assembly protein PilV
MSIVEVLISMLVLVTGLLGVFGVLSASGKAISSGERQAAMTQVAEQTLQAAEALPYTSIADSSTPSKTTTTDTTNPTYYLTCTAGTCTYQWDPSSSSSSETVAVDTTNGKLAPGPTTVVVAAPYTSGCTTSATTNCQMTFAVYTFVTNTTDSVCSQSGVTCSGTSYKRITVAVKNTGTGAPLSPVYLSAFVGNNAGGASNPLTSSSTQCLDGTTTVSCTH